MHIKSKLHIRAESKEDHGGDTHSPRMQGQQSVLYRREDEKDPAHPIYDSVPLMFLVSTLFLAMMFGWAARSAAVQDDSPVIWKDAELVYTTDGDILQPSEIVADTFGRVHIFWSERPISTTNERQRYFINYSRRDGTRLSWPVDILGSPGGSDALMAKAVVDSADVVQLIWRATAGIEYSYAAAAAAESGNNWMRPETFVDEGTVEINSTLDENEQLHIGYAVWEDGIYHLRYDLTTGILGNPVLVNIPAASDSSPNAPLVSVSEDGTIHMWWTEVLIDNASPLAVYYSRSEDEGLSWSTARIIHEGGFRAEDVAQTGNEIHLLLLGAANVKTRGHLWSPDEGLTWSAFNEIVPSNQGAGRSHGGIVVDDDGRVFAAFGMLVDSAVGYASWDGNSWSEPAILPGLEGISFEDIRLAIGSGNRLHLMFVDAHQKIWYVEGTTQAATRPTPTAIVANNGTEEGNAAASGSELEPTATPSAVPVFDNPPRATNSVTPILVASLAAMIFVAIVFLVFKNR